ncbi:SDR family NAD(P)-dependent oxidoreductase [Hafnia paralvei]|uniref:SDR family NAD(P)-dependent oxidoreductase n=1 Tax=Hafnia paralvei TaxID=546367 RepID=UPI000DF1D8D1|nr:SDR family oxidoreductase [Hafnia paralvei]RDA64935.1 SDR family NAD(P)-dependent oxidoreductase [Hafnia paralvei]RDA66444.1 SDR family NAD(P)-dependent oxidoreductase [Hafnia paralvei]RDA67909.1 SDR family NAD(P)-dependent oxidoreductase [Hafnia paralvei]RDA76901.1 SDR family NAD(P)-dependent oxidoreductase [Hafnia paralvei]RDA77401.1 SDR family NAD(P)-dependent oxidoreductase [Hafnia paralvei]
MKQNIKVAVITGGSRGLGRSTVINLAKRGVHSIFTFNSGEQEAKEVTQAATEAGAKAIAIHLNTANIAGFDAFSTQVKNALAELNTYKFNYLVNNAGISNHTPFMQVTEEELDLQFQVNFKGVFFLTQKLLPLLRDGGQIVNISSGVTRFVNPNSVAYATVKGAIEVFTRYMAHDLGPRNISVNTVAPGAIQTDFSGGVVRDNPEINQLVSNMTALGRPGLPDDIGKMLASFLSDDNHWVNAQRIEVSGGMRL